MNIFKVFISIFLAGTLFLATVAYAEESPEPSTGVNALILNGELIAQEISRATGLAISPILGISVLGAYTYYTTPLEERETVPWNVKPRFWGPLLCVLLAIILKDSSKVALPKILLVPLDTIEALLEKNTSAVLALVVVLTSITGKGIEQFQIASYKVSGFLFPQAHAVEGMASQAVSSETTVLSVAMLGFLLTVIYGVVWVVSQSFNFLIFLCPFSWIDLLLTLLKNALVMALLGAYLFHPYAGLFVSVVIILISLVFFAWSYRFVILGTLVSYDLFRKGSYDSEPDTENLRVFSGPAMTGVPSMSYGILRRKGDFLEFTYRPWLCLPSKIFTSREPREKFLVGRGTFTTTLVRETGLSSKYEIICRFRPRYLSHEEQIAQSLGLGGSVDLSLGKTLREGFRWLADMLGLRSISQQS